MQLHKTYSYQTNVDFDLLDAGDVVYHPNYLVLCERARNAALTEAGVSFHDLWQQNLAFAVLEVSSKYIAAIGLKDQLTITTTAKEYSGARLKVHQEIRVASGKVAFEVDFVLGLVTMRPIKIARPPADLAAALGLKKT